MTNYIKSGTLTDHDPWCAQSLGKPISWNTHRPYSETGQLIFAKVLDDGRVAFHDATRGIVGVTKLPIALVDSIETHVMYSYDRGYYDDLSSQAWYEMTKGD